jgi:hypothetical protein
MTDRSAPASVDAPDTPDANGFPENNKALMGMTPFQEW